LVTGKGNDVMGVDGHWDMADLIEENIEKYILNLKNISNDELKEALSNPPATERDEKIIERAEIKEALRRLL